MQHIKNCIYHSRDLDGWTSAAIVKRVNPDVNLIGYDYGQDADEVINQIGEGEVTVMADVSFPAHKMDELNKKADLIWIDHHLSAINEMEQYEEKHSLYPLDGRRNSDFAACELVWSYFLPNVPVPLQLYLLGCYDSFRHKGTEDEDRVLEFQYYARSVAQNPEECAQFLDESVETGVALAIGRGIYKYLIVEAQQIYRKGFAMDFDGQKFIAFNRERFNPINFGIHYHDKYAGAACFWLSGKDQWSFSLYNDDGFIDVSEICKKRGGGGHTGAAGFVCNTKELIKML